MFVVHKLGPLFHGPPKYAKSHPRLKHFLIIFEYIPNDIRYFMPILTSIHPYPTSIVGQGVTYGDEIFQFKIFRSASYTNIVNYLASKHSKKQLVHF
jgi:hypothetical protein